MSFDSITAVNFRDSKVPKNVVKGLRLSKLNSRWLVNGSNRFLRCFIACITKNTSEEYFFFKIKNCSSQTPWFLN